MRRYFGMAMVGLVGVLAGYAAQAQDAKAPDKAAVERARAQVQMLDDLYKNAVVSITKRYVDDQAATPAAMVAKDVFAAMHKKGYHNARLIDATGNPKNKQNIARTAFEKKAVEKMKAGEAYFEEIGEADGKPIFRAATIVPAVMRQCATCHAKKEGALLGAIVYEVPVK